MSGRVARSLCTAVLAAAVAASPAVAEPSGPEPAPAPAAGPAPQSVAGLLKQLQTLYRKAEEAGELHNGTEEELKKRAAEAGKLRGELAEARAALDSGRRDAGRLARDQYQGRTDFSMYLRLLLADDPARALEQSHVIERAQAGRSAVVERLTGAERHAEVLAAKSRAAQDRQRELTAQRKEQHDTVRSRLKAIEAMLASLSTGQLEALSALEEKNIGEAQDALTASGALSSVRTPSGEGGKAVRYAVEQIGKPYVWGAEGPETYDCSGLTSQAWSAAGRDIPRTSQEQWRRLPKVPLGSLRPGDLVVYFPKATHVALYIGDGLVIQAPRPGTTVKVSPLASNPLLGAVRPDPDSEPLSAYTLPELPEDATSGPDTGYDAPHA
ncbi:MULTISPECIES: C40 family peptidase [Streptomyces]|uniref:NlpC/P60 family protein n=1 Tax=Streptomyces glycanivorans TaxID=3033808 RepID=A0ABY9JDL8_9ACTN|nr:MULTISPECIES: C40 family peptidase [unclassified Streptomyces]WSQ77590.1 NlpC/P60 family protein [Streptomyces sp. NBC_01213]TXS18052.1 glycoside hydrolase [Streptomyces sp. wa22]WLQ64197.1 NlpC/P60 family protein [Streptomyces sp. Alt3]WSQ84950.1 NlpC/P60 family protein [Streptomyces sp. NBC_01212]WSR08967.1 NlpC/P60 family protein [Streptomyces sp. NBC_01208]